MTLDEMASEPSNGATEWATTISAKDANEVAMFNLIPKGRYTAVLAGYKTDVKKTEGGDHPFEGKPFVRADFVLNGDSRDYHLFIDLIPEVIKATSKAGGSYICQESQNAAGLMEALGMLGEDFNKVLTVACEKTVNTSVRISNPKDPQYKPRSTVKFFPYRAV